ncbi:MAG TPA: hypothetical protein VJV78_34265 [Polyangiales bacterium]|nr:hypothetical protein [Polyangiales bacterium]
MITIERAKVEDVDLIKQASSETWLATYAAHLSRSTIEQVTTHWHDPLLLRAQIETSKDYFAVARDAGIIIGLITAVALNQDELPQKSAVLVEQRWMIPREPSPYARECESERRFKRWRSVLGAEVGRNDETPDEADERHRDGDEDSKGFRDFLCEGRFSSVAA